MVVVSPPFFFLLFFFLWGRDKYWGGKIKYIHSPLELYLESFYISRNIECTKVGVKTAAVNSALKC